MRRLEMFAQDDTGTFVCVLVELSIVCAQHLVNASATAKK